MANEQNRSEKDESQPYSFSDEATKNKIKKHLNDINDVITEEDIANAKVPGEEEELPVLPEEDKFKKKDENKVVDPGEGKPITPWDVIN